MNATTYAELHVIATNVFGYLYAESLAVSAQGEWSGGRWVAAKQKDSEVETEIVFASHNTEGCAGMPVVATFALINGEIVQLSKLHIDVIGGYEYYYGNDGSLFAAPLSSVIDNGFRIGRFEAPSHLAQQALGFAREMAAKV